MSQQNFVKISSLILFSFSSLSFLTLCENRYNSHMRAPIWLKFGSCIWGLKADASINLWVNLINIEEVISDFYALSEGKLLSHLQGKPLQGTS